MKKFLISSEEKELRLRHRSEKNGRVRDRIKAVLLSNKGWSYRQIAEALLLDEETVSRHVSEYREENKLELESGGSASKLNSLQTSALNKHLSKTTYVKVQDICAYVLSKYGVSYTVSGMRSWLHQNGFSYKKPKGTPCKADALQQEKWQEYYLELLEKTPTSEPIEFGDGVHPTMSTKISYGWIKKGHDKLIETTGNRSRMNLMGSINLKTMDVTIDNYQTIDSSAMYNHFQLLRKKYKNAEKIHLILDRGSYNTSIHTKESAKKYGIELHYLPPYSPNLNPIERLWKVMNEYCRNNRYFSTAKEFRQTINNFFDHTWPKIAHNMTHRINDNFQLLKPSL